MSHKTQQPLLTVVMKQISQATISSTSVQSQAEQSWCFPMLKIAFLSHFYPPLHNAGIEQATHALAKGLIKAGQLARVLCVGNWDTGDEYWQGYTEDEWEGVSVRRLNVNWGKAKQPNRYLYDNPVLAEHVKAFLEAFRPDIVHIASMYTLSASMVRVIKDLNVPIVFTLSDYWTICPRHTLMQYSGELCNGQVSSQTCQNCLMSESRLYRLFGGVIPQPMLTELYYQLIRQPALAKHIPGMLGWGINIEERRQTIFEAMQHIDLALAPSAFTRDIFVGAGITNKIEVWHHGNDLTWLKAYKPRQEDGKIHIGYIGQIHRLKGIHLLIDAFQACNLDDRFQLYVYGNVDTSSEYGAYLHTRAASNTSIHFPGRFTRDKLPEVLGNIDVLVVPSIWPEVAGLVVQEAFAAKIPVIASHMGGLPEFVGDNKGGMIFNPSHPHELEQILLRIANGGTNYLDSLRRTIPPVRQSDHEVADLIQVYRNVIALRLENNT